MLSTTILLVVAVLLFACWAVLGGWVLVERYLYDRLHDEARRDTDSYLDGRLDLEEVGRRRLTRLALGPSSVATTAAAAVLAARWQRLVAEATGPGAKNSRVEALTILVRAGFPDALELIRRAVAEGDPALTTSVLRVTAELETDAADAFLLEVLVEGTHPRARTATELGPRVARMHEPLVALVSDDDPTLRYWAITLLIPEMGDSDVALAATSRAGDSDANVRAAVAEALGACDPRIARPLLRRLLRDDAFFVRAHAARAVAQARDGSLAVGLLPLLADRNWWVRAAAKESLLQLGDAGLDVARSALSHADRFARDGALEIILGSGRMQELEVLADTGDAGALETVAAIHAQTAEWTTETLPRPQATQVKLRDRAKAAA